MQLIICWLFLVLHNGTIDTSLGFHYASAIKGNVNLEQFQNVPLYLLEIDNVLYRNGFWYGTYEELYKIDPFIALKLPRYKNYCLLLIESDIGLYVLITASDIKSFRELSIDSRRLSSQLIE